MADNELLIKINADAANATKAFEDVKGQTEDLESSLADVAKISAVAFAAFTGEVFLAVKAFGEAEQASRNLAATLQNQGIYSKELAANYREQASALQEVTGLDDDAIVNAQATAQAFLGQTKVTKELTKAIADYAEFKKIDLSSAAEILSKTIGTETNVLARSGLQLDATATSAERYAKVLEFVNLKAGGLAEAANQGLGSVRGLQSAFGDFQEAIGAKFAPIIEIGISGLTKFFKAMQDPVLVTVTASILTAVGAVAAIGIAVPVAVSAFTAFSAAMAAFGVVSNVALAGIPLLIGAIAAGAVAVALNFETVQRVAVSVAAGIAEAFKGIATGLVEIGLGIATLNFSKVKDGLKTITEAAIEGNKERLRVNQEFIDEKKAQDEKADAGQDTAKKAAADKEAARLRAEADQKLQIQKATNDVLRLQNENASAEQIALKQQEASTLQAIAQANDATQIALLQEKLTQIRALEDNQRLEDVERARAFAEEDAAAKQELAALGFENDAILQAQKRAQLEASLMTEKDAEQKVMADTLKARIENRNLELQDRIKYGKTVSTINEALRSDEVTGTKAAAGELVQLQQSKNSTLKSIGKAAAVAQIAIATAESAMNIYRGFSTIPIIGPALGVVGAAAAVAFGAERTGNVLAAADGGLVTGGIPGQDSVPSLLMPGELVVPKRNFNDVVGAVSGSGGRDDEIVSLLSDIKEKQIASGNTIINGDVSTDDTYVDALVKKISEAVEFRNAFIFGVTT